MQNEKNVERAFERPVRRILGVRHLEHHVQKVAGIAQIVIGIDITQAAIVPISVRGDRRHFCDEAFDLCQPLVGVIDLVSVGIKRRQRSDSADEHSHRMRVVAKRLHQRLYIFVDKGVMRNVVGPRRQLFLVRQLAEKDQVRDFQKIAVLSELFDGVAAVLQDALVAVNEGNRTFRGCCIHQRRVASARNRPRPS